VSEVRYGIGDGDGTQKLPREEEFILRIYNALPRVETWRTVKLIAIYIRKQTIEVPSETSARSIKDYQSRPF
jgi:hypothetical protein